jgi:D-alanyl-D-alanine carboxypeptidase/D-alanyl-D-alanine-endopeptidase (penicillin-binding protein 4)
MLRQLEQMLGDSDNTLAEALARQVAIAKGKPASFDGAAEAVEQVLTELGLPVGQLDLADGAGYSTQNQLSPNVLTGLMTKAADGGHPGLADLFNLLPVAGWSGSMDYRFAKPEAASGLGVVRAKSGTLQKVNSISGIVQTIDGGLLAFAVLAENVPTWQYPAQDALDKIVAKIASCGCS